MGAIAALWVPCVVLAHVFGVLCLALGPLRIWLNARGGAKAFLARRRGSIPGKLPKAHDSDDEGDDALDVDAITRPQHHQQFQQQKGATAWSPATATVGANADGPAASQKPQDVDKLSGDHAEHVHLEWQSIHCSYTAAQGKINVLQDIWGKAAPGEMQALMGPSGAGKSTLMDILAQRKSVGNLSGFLLVNGEPATNGFVRKTAYVPQEDNFVATMTALETLNFYASITLPDSLPKVQRKHRVAEVLTAMGLKHRQKTMVGGTLPGGLMLRGLSGGERKRLSIAAGILATPSVIFLDEPTSGLDSFAALSVMGHLKRMARENRHAVIASIHQPRAAIWNMFDKVTLVASGRLMFFGPPDDLVPWFDHLGYKYDPASHGVASDWALDLVAIGFHKPMQLFGHSITTMEELQMASVQFVANYRDLSGAVLYRGGSQSMMIGPKSLKHRVRARMQKYSGVQPLPSAQQQAGCEPGLQVYVGAQNSANSSSDSPGQASGKVVVGDPVGSGVTDGGLAGKAGPDSVYATGWWQQFAACYGRELLAVTRNPADVAGRVLTFAWVGILTGVLFYNLPGDVSSLQRRLNLVFSNLAFVCLMPYISMSLYTADKKFYLADTSAQLYRPHAYYAAKVAATLPFHVAAALVFSFIVYGMAGLRPGASYIWQNGLLNTLLSLISVQVMHGCAILAPNQDGAFMLSICWTAIQLLMSNFFITFSSVKLHGITELRYISALYYTFEGVARTEFANKYFRCNTGMDDSTIALLRQLLPRTKILSTPLMTNALKNPGSDCLADSNAVLGAFDYTRPFGQSVGILVAYLVGTHILTYTWMIIVARHEQR